MSNTLRLLLRSGWIAVLLLILSVWGALAQGNGNFVNGEAIITVPAGTALSTVNAIASSVNATVVRAFPRLDYARSVDAYQLRSTGNLDANATLAAVAKLKADARLRYAGANVIYRALQAGGATAIPNDPRFNEQWDKTIVHLPEAWAIEKGENRAVIAIIDSGLDTSHPEFPAARVYMPYNTVDTPHNNNPNPVGTGNGHGTHVAGIAAAQGNNSTGICGTCWNNVLIMPIKAGSGGGFTQAALLDAVAYVQAQMAAAPTKAFVLNLSLGIDTTGSPSLNTQDPFELGLLSLAKSGCVICCAAGNWGDSPGPATGVTNAPVTPAWLAALNGNIICVNASNHLDKKSHYSQFQPYTTVAAPGGDDIAGKLILSTLPAADGSYGFEQGTSMASPQVAGLAGLMLSLPGVRPGDIKPALMATADLVDGKTGFSAEYGAGRINAYKALLKVAISVNVIAPDGSGGNNVNKPGTPLPVETLQPEIRIHVSQITPDNLVVKVDGVVIPQADANGLPVPSYTIQNITATTTDSNGNTVPSSYDVVINNLQLSPGSHTINVSGTKPGNPDITVTDTRNFTITPHVLPAGRSMISFPYYQVDGATAGSTLTPEVYLGTDFQLARWVPSEERYAFYTSFGVKDPFASFQPPDVRPHLDGDNSPLYPLGIGYWLDAGSVKPVLTHGRAITDRSIVIPLTGNGSGNTSFVSWNMIGDPFPFDVPFASLLVDTPTGRISITEAVTRGLILQNVFSFDASTGYTYRTLPDGSLQAWQAHWIGVTSRDNLALVVPPTGSLTRAAAIGGTEPNSVGGWTLRLSANAKSLHDTFNFIGVSSRAADGYGKEDAPKPPLGSPYLTLGIQHADWGNRSGLYAADIRNAGGVKSWTVTVNTDQANADVIVNWSGRTLPRNQKLSIKDETTGQVTDMRTRSSLSFNSGANPGTRKFTITARPTAGDAILHISNMNVRSGDSRAPGARIAFTMSADATYDVRILSTSGSQVSTLTSRAAGAGDVNLYWNGKDTAGRNVASGTYLVQVRATTADGESVKVVYPFAVIR